jgi:hypothetical protein
LKLKSLAVITLLVLGCSAAFAQGSGVLGFTTSGGNFLYCNYEEFVYGGSNNYYFTGEDVATPCGTGFSSTIEGTKASITPADGSPVQTGPAYVYADAVYSNYGYGGQFQWFVVTQIKPSKLLHKFGWAGYIGEYGDQFLANYGYLSASLPGASGSKPSNGTSNAGAGKAADVKSLTKMVGK